MIQPIQSLEEYQNTYAKSIEDPASFWEDIANTFTWQKKWSKTLEWEFNAPQVKWFVDGKLNITENCIDRHLHTRADKTALTWIPNDPKDEHISYTYQHLSEKVNQLANVLKNNGIQKGDRVCIYMPMIPELLFSVLACARIGAIHSVVFAGFSARSLSDRIRDAQCKMVLTADVLYRGQKTIAIKQIVDEALTTCDSVETVLVYRRNKEAVPWKEGRDKHWQEEIRTASTICTPEMMDAEDPLFILYTSGSTGKPKGIVHTCGGYMVYTAYSFTNVFQCQEDDVYWCTADIGWITGHSYIVYGPLLTGTTTLMFEGVPTWPDAGRFWDIVDQFRVSHFYTAPTAIRALMAKGLEFVQPYQLDSLKIIGTVGEPINEEAWRWYDTHIGKGKCTVVDTWWQTETGGIMISSIPGCTESRPTYAGLPLPGISPVLVDTSGNEIDENNVEGLLCIKHPWPSILRTTWGDHNRCQKTYFSAFSGMYFTGDGAKRDDEGRYRIIGRVDDVINVSGHRLGTAEVENAINQHPFVVESAVVGFTHEIKGQGIYAYVILTQKNKNDEQLRSEIEVVVRKEIGAIARPDKIQFVSDLPKTRSGKIMRRILRKIADGNFSDFGDTSTLLNPSVVSDIQAGSLTTV